MIVTVLFALRPFCDNKRYFFFFFFFEQGAIIYILHSGIQTMYLNFTIWFWNTLILQTEF